jgi:hypothetical protein
MRKTIPIFFVLLLLGSACSTFRGVEDLRAEAQSEFPQTTARISTASQILGKTVPAPFSAIPPIAEEIAILLLGAFAVWKHQRVRKIEKALNGFVEPVKTATTSTVSGLGKTPV